MKKILFIVLFFSISTFLVISIIKNIKETESQNQLISNLPHFALNTVDNSIFDTDSLLSGPILINFFDPSCEYCLDEITEIGDNINQLSEITLIFITNQIISKKSEKNIFGSLKNNNQVFVLVDKDYLTMQLFDVRVIPTNILYGGDLKLLKRFEGQIKVETIIKYCYEN